MQSTRSGFTIFTTALTAATMLVVSACSSTPKAPDVTGSVRDAINNVGLKDVSVDQDRDKGVVTLGGHVQMEASKSQAEAIAKSVAPGQVIANQIAVLPPGLESTAKDIHSDIDKGIEKNLDAAFLGSALKDDAKDISFEVKSGVVTLTGKVNSAGKRASAQAIAAKVPYVEQVVNKLEVKNQQATTTH